MPALNDFRHEAFAQACANGARFMDAYQDAGFSPDGSHASRLARRDDVAGRIAELRGARAAAEDSDPQTIIDALMRMARDSEALKTPAGVKEARLNMLEVHRLRAAVWENRNSDRNHIARARGAE
jgi:hypothetical protein